MIVVAGIDLTHDISSRMPGSDIHLRACQRGLIEPDVTHARQPGAEFLHRLLAVVFALVRASLRLPAVTAMAQLFFPRQKDQKTPTNDTAFTAAGR